MSAAFFTDNLFLEHKTGAGHPEAPSRLEAIRARLEEQSYFPNFQTLEPRFAKPEEAALIHEAGYIDSLKRFCEAGGGYLDGDTPVSERSYEAACLALGAGLTAAEKIVAGELDRALLLLRPPGHHSLRDRAMGFCLFNNIAVAAARLKELGLKRIAILDWDVHHGNGTEAAFYEDPEVFFLSLHQYPFYPGTGAPEDRGAGAGEGFTLNLPQPSGAGDAEYRRAFENQVPAALEKFNPEILLISAGFDAHRADPLAGINLSTSSFEWMTERMRKFAEDHCEGRLISFLEGGYNLDALADCLEAHAAVLV